MKRSFLSIFASVLSIGAPILSPTKSLAIAQMPYLAADCGVSIISPKGGGESYFSRDCRVAYVLPPKFGKAEIKNIAPSGNIMQCPGYFENMSSVNDYQRMKAQNNTVIRDLRNKNPLDPKIDRLLTQNRQIEQDLKSMGVEYRKVAGAAAQVLLDAGFTKDWVDEWRLANTQLTQMKGTVITEAPIDQAFLSFSSVSQAEAAAELDPMVLSSTIKGFRQEGDTNTVDSVYGLGTSSGKVVLSLSGACPLLKNTEEIRRPSEAVFDGKKILAHFAPNYTYSVPVMSSIKMTAVLNLNNAINTMSSLAGRAGQFTNDQVLKVDVDGQSTEVCKIEYERNSADKLDTQQADLFEQNAKKDICKDLLTRLTTKMAEAGVVDQITKFKSAEDPKAAGGNVLVTSVRNECHIKKTWGIFPKRICSDVVYSTPVWKDGSVSKELFIRDASQTAISFVLEMNQPIQRWKTSTFDTTLDMQGN